MSSESNGPKISVLMNCYNGEEYLREAIDSLIEQTYENWELIFWDNQSTDRSADLVKSYDDDRIRYFYAPEHTGLGKARELAAQKVEGDWIGFLDDDDIWLSEKLEKQVSIIREEDEELGLVYGRAVSFKTNDERSERDATPNLETLPEGDVLRDLMFYNFIIFVTAMVRTEVFDELGGFSSKYDYAPDYDLFMQIADQYKIRAVQDYVAKRRRHEDCLSAEISNLTRHKENFSIVSNYFNQYPLFIILTPLRLVLVQLRRFKSQLGKGLRYCLQFIAVSRSGN